MMTNDMERNIGLVRNLDVLKCKDSNPMYLYSDPSDDVRHPKTEAGAYEWWYFDALDPVSGYGIVVILYDGLLFSPDYHEAVRSGLQETAEHHPGFSLSIYRDDETIFYSLASYLKDTAHFGDVNEPVQIGSNRVVSEMLDGKLIYHVHIDETLPSGLKANGMLSFESPYVTTRTQMGNPQSHHRWNLVQPNSMVNGQVMLSKSGRPIETCSFATRGYHDHNIGLRPLKRDFDEWYWGRIHIGDKTLLWYNMCTLGQSETSAWLIEDAGVDFGKQISMVGLGDISQSVFSLKKERRWSVDLDGEQYLVIEDHIWDNGPFYQRYKVKLVDVNEKDVAGALPGIAEYIKPDRIEASWVRPMIRIRHHQNAKQGNWIQRSAVLSRLTW
jgi:carotenoid 1,2-hydratase